MNRAQVYIAGPEEAIRIGQDGSCHVRTDFPCDLLLAGGTLYIASGEVYINDRPVPRAAGKAGGGAAAGKLEAGDFFRTGTLTVTMKDGGIACSGTGFSVCLPQAPPPTGAMDMGDFPEYKRPPRIIKNIEAKTVEVKPPKAKEKPKKGQILKTVLPPLIMAALMTSSRVMGGGNLITMFMGAGMAVAAVFSITSFFSDKKDRKEAERKRKKSYGEYLLMKRKELHAVRAAEEEARTYAYPELPEIERLTKGLSGRIYERTPHDGDFLSVSLGRAGAVPAFKVTFNDDEFAGDEDELLKEARGVVKGFRTLPDMPLTASLRGAHLGLVGEKGLARDALHSLIAQICFLHSYHDVEIVMAIDAEDREYFEWATWYPHFKISAINLSGLITSENHRDMALGALTQIFKDRKMKRDEHKKESLYLPHFVVIVLSPGMVVNHSVMEYLKEADTSLGFSLIWASPMTESLPENIGTILSLDGKERGKLLMNEGRFAMTPVKLPETDGIGFERMSRRLTAIRHNQGVTTQIPEAVTFFEMMGIKKPEELNVLSLWRESNSAKSLAVPLGFRGPKDTVYLNLHEKAHGPHGLVAGTTGSGKSEILQSYIISLALHFHPYEVGFLLIDYKGGGMANLFAGLPHLLGTITNLDGSESMRALASIKSELARRQRIFTDVGVNNISAYAKAFRKGEAVIPLPHLFIISDEFAELKKEQPDFMAELISAARIGRSLGVHLILATQKPSGVVNDQIWSNSKFKLCLKVQDSSDSNEILKTPDAAMITIPGRSYLQVGNNEIYELFQSAWSGAEFSEQEVKQGFDERIYLVNELGQGELLNKDLSAETEVIESKLTQLDVVVQHISAVWDSLPSKPVDKPWLPPLPQKIVSPAVKIPECPPDGMDLSAPVGLVDIPEEQKQMEYVHDFSKDGNFAVFGASGFGKSICLMNMVLTLSARNTPDDLHFYIMDLGNSALIQLKNLPHTADYITYEPMEKISKFVRIMEEQISRRKSLFAKESAINFKMYRQVAKEKLPAIFVVVDGFDVVKEIPLELAEFFLKLTRDGTGIGIYSIFSVTQISTIRYAILNNFKAKIGLYLFDKSEYTNIVGRPNYTLPDVKGRAFIKLASPCIMQCYLPAPYEDDVSFTGQAGAFVSGLARLYPGTYAPRIPMLPDAVTMRDIEREESVPWYMAPVGLDAEHVTRQYIDSRESKHLIIGKPRTGRSNMLKVFLSGVFGRKYLADSSACELEGFRSESGVVYLAPAGDIEVFAKAMKEDAEARQKLFEEKGGGARPKDFFATIEPASLFIDDLEGFVKTYTGKEESFAAAISLFIAAGGVMYVTVGVNGIRGFDALAGALKDTTKGVVLGNPGDQSIFTGLPRSVKPQIDIGYLVGYGDATKIKLPLV